MNGLLRHTEEVVGCDGSKTIRVAPQRFSSLSRTFGIKAFLISKVPRNAIVRTKRRLTCHKQEIRSKQDGDSF